MKLYNQYEPLNLIISEYNDNLNILLQIAAIFQMKFNSMQNPETLLSYAEELILASHKRHVELKEQLKKMVQEKPCDHFGAFMGDTCAYCQRIVPVVKHVFKNHHDFKSYHDRLCEKCNRPDRDDIHKDIQ